LGEGWFDDRSEPEPDVCVVRGSPRDYVESHPTRPALVVEVAQAGLRIARRPVARSAGDPAARQPERPERPAHWRIPACLEPTD